MNISKAKAILPFALCWVFGYLTHLRLNAEFVKNDEQYGDEWESGTVAHRNAFRLLTFFIWPAMTATTVVGWLRGLRKQKEENPLGAIFGPDCGDPDCLIHGERGLASGNPIVIPFSSLSADPNFLFRED